MSYRMTSVLAFYIYLAFSSTSHLTFAMYSPYSHDYSGRCIFTLPLPLTNIDAELVSTPTPMAPKSKPSKLVNGPKLLHPLVAPALESLEGTAARLGVT